MTSSYIKQKMGQLSFELIKLFASTWFSLDTYDKSQLPESGWNKKQVEITAGEPIESLAKLKDGSTHAVELFKS